MELYHISIIYAQPGLLPSKDKYHFKIIQDLLCLCGICISLNAYDFNVPNKTIQNNNK